LAKTKRKKKSQKQSEVVSDDKEESRATRDEGGRKKRGKKKQQKTHEWHVARYSVMLGIRNLFAHKRGAPAAGVKNQPRKGSGSDQRKSLWANDDHRGYEKEIKAREQNWEKAIGGTEEKTSI